MKLKQKLDIRTMGYISTFEKVTRTEYIDFYEHPSSLLFIIPQKDLKRAVGPQGKNVKKLTYLLNKKIKIIGLSDDPKKFLTDLIYPINPSEITQENNNLKAKFNSRIEKARDIGREGNNLELTNSFLKKHYNLEFKVI